MAVITGGKFSRVVSHAFVVLRRVNKVGYYDEYLIARDFTLTVARVCFRYHEGAGAW